MLKIKVKADPGVVLPLYRTSEEVGLKLMAKSFKKLFKGNKEVHLDKKLQQSIEEGYVTLRGFERVLIGTGLHIEVPEGYEVQIRSTEANALKKGLLVASSPCTISSAYKGELAVTLVNNTPFLSRIQLGDIIAIAVASKVQHIMWDLKK